MKFRWTQSKSNERDRVRLFAGFFVLGVLVFWTYRFGFIDFPRTDQLTYDAEKAQFDGATAWFWHALSYNRTRFQGQGDAILFRPGLHSVLALESIFDGARKVTGVLSVLMHLSVVILLYVSLREIYPGTEALLYAALLAVQFAGIEMILWRHISPYMLSVAFTLLGFLAMDSAIAAGSLFLAAMLFHESAVVSLGMLAFILMFSRRRSAAAPIAVALVLYFSWDVTDWIVRAPHEFFGAIDHPDSLLMNPVRTASLLLAYIGASTQAVFWPFSINLEWARQTYLWDFRMESSVSLLAWCAFGLGISTWTLVRAIPRILKAGAVPDILAAWAVLGSLATAALVSLGRAGLRSSDYLAFATYDYWFFALFLLVQCKYVISDAERARPSRRVFGIAAYLIVCGIIAAEARMGRSIIQGHYWPRSIAARLAVAR